VGGGHLASGGGEEKERQSRELGKKKRNPILASGLQLHFHYAKKSRGILSSPLAVEVATKTLPNNIVTSSSQDRIKDPVGQVTSVPREVTRS